MAEPTNATAQTTVDANGLAQVDESVFLPEEDQVQDAAPETQQTQAVDTKQTTQTEKADTIVQQTQQTQDQQTQTTETGKPIVPGQQTTPTLLAGKYQTVAELKSAFQELGGNPENYKTAQLLEEAYQARNSEFTRARQETLQKAQQMQKELEESLKLGPNGKIQEAQPEKPLFDLQKFTNEAINKIQFKENMTQQEYAAELIKALVPGIQSMIPQIPEQKELDGQAMLQKMLPFLSEYQQQEDARKQTLSEIEKEVPRLKSDLQFRNLFALHLQNGKYDKTIDGMRQGLKDLYQIMGVGQQEQQQTQQAQQEIKQSAQPAPEQTSTKSTQSTKQMDDEVGDILDAYKEDKAKITDAFY